MKDTADLAAERHISLEQRVRQRAHEIWLSRRETGVDTSQQDWLEAEREVLGHDGNSSPQDRGTTIGPAGTQYEADGKTSGQKSQAAAKSRR
jgi:hypothetical protein